MKRVLIPIDFSNDSINALEYGIEMANYLSANVRIMHVKTGINYMPSFAKDQATSRLNGQVERWMDEIKDQHQIKYQVPGGQLDYKVREGNVAHEISNQAKYDDSSLIVVGSHGESGFQDRWIGSNAFRLAAHSPCPVIVVGKGMKWGKGIRRIVVPIDYTKASRQKIPVLAGVARHFKARVDLVGLKQSNFQFIVKRIGQFNKQVERFLREKAGVEVRSSIFSGKHLGQQMIDYADKVDADMVTIHIHHSSNPFSNLFRPFANELINRSTKPVFVIPTKE